MRSTRLHHPCPTTYTSPMHHKLLCPVLRTSRIRSVACYFPPLTKQQTSLATQPLLLCTLLLRNVLREYTTQNVATDVCPPKMARYYGVRRGYVPGVYLSWDDCQRHVSGFPGAEYKRFSSLDDAKAYVAVVTNDNANNDTKDDDDNNSISSNSSTDRTEHYIKLSPTANFYLDVKGDQNLVSQDEVSLPSDAKRISSPESDKKQQRYLTSDYLPLPPSKRSRLSSQEEDTESSARITLANGNGTTNSSSSSSSSSNDSNGNNNNIVQDNVYADGAAAGCTNQESATGIGPVYGKDVFVINKRSSETVYTDGSCLSNGKVGEAQAGYGIWFGSKDSRNMFGPIPNEYGKMTNSVAEAYALLRLLEDYVVRVPARDRLTVCTDSEYVIGRIAMFSKQNEVSANAANKQLWKHIMAALARVQCELRFKHVYGHSGVHGNVEADSLARLGAKLAKKM